MKGNNTRNKNRDLIQEPTDIEKFKLYVRKLDNVSKMKKILQKYNSLKWTQTMNCPKAI